jgi:hypothetical protein
MLPSACSFIVDGLTFSCRCSTLHVSAYMAIFMCMMFHFYIPEGICFAAFVAFSCTWLYYACSHLCFSVVFSLVSWFLCACLLSCLSLLSIGSQTDRRQHNLKTHLIRLGPEAGQPLPATNRLSCGTALRQSNQNIISYTGLEWVCISHELHLRQESQCHKRRIYKQCILAHLLLWKSSIHNEKVTELRLINL